MHKALRLNLPSSVEICESLGLDAFPAHSEGAVMGPGTLFFERLEDDFFLQGAAGSGFPEDELLETESDRV